VAMQHHPSDYRMMAAMCEEIANGMLLDADRLHLTDRAQEWLELAQQTEAEQLPKIADGPLGESLRSLESQTQTDAIDPGEINEAEQLPGLTQIYLESQAQAEVIELVQTTQAEQLTQNTYSGRVESVQNMGLKSQTDAKSRTETDFIAENLEIADDARVGIVIVGAGRRRWMLSNVLLLAVLALVLTLVLAWGP
jgi:hypothetical protein